MVNEKLDKIAVRVLAEKLLGSGVFSGSSIDVIVEHFLKLSISNRQLTVPFHDCKERDWRLVRVFDDLSVIVYDLSGRNAEFVE